MSLRTKRNLLYATSWILRVLPLLILFVVKWDNWVIESGASESVANFKLAVGGIMLLAFVGMAVLDKLPKPNGIMFPTILLIICYTLQSFLNDLTQILGMYVLGGALSLIVDQFIKKTKRDINIKDGAEANANEMRTILTELLGDKSHGEQGT